MDRGADDALLGDDPPEPPRNQRRHIRQDSRKDEPPQPSRARKVAGGPDGVEFVFVVAEALEVVEVLAVAEDEGSETAPEGGQGSRFHAGEGGHA